MSDLQDAFKRWDNEEPVTVQELAEFVELARRFANLTSPETIEKAARVIDSMMHDEVDDTSWRMVTDVAEAVLRSVEEGET